MKIKFNNSTDQILQMFTLINQVLEFKFFFLEIQTQSNHTIVDNQGKVVTF